MKLVKRTFFRGSRKRGRLISRCCLVLCLCSWLVIPATAVFFPGGHPPLVAYIAVPIILATSPFNLIGLAAIRPLLQYSTPSLQDRLLLFGHIVMLAVAALVTWRVFSISLLGSAE